MWPCKCDNMIRIQSLTALYFTGPLSLTANNLKKTPFMTNLQQMTGTVCYLGLIGTPSQ